MKRIGSAAELSALQKKLQDMRDPKKPLITICAGTGCQGQGCIKVKEALEAEIDKQGFSGKVAVRATGCHGFCEKGPLVVIHPQKIFYQQVKIDDAADIIAKTIAHRRGAGAAAVH